MPSGDGSPTGPARGADPVAEVGPPAGPSWEIGRVVAARQVLPCNELEPTLAFFVERLGFRLDAIGPADRPRRALISGHGLRLELREGRSDGPGTLVLACSELPGDAATDALRAPNGTRIELVAADAPVVVPPLHSSLVVSKRAAADHWEVGRAGMRYRDLVPDRQGGRFVVSHILVPEGGPVPDYVHFHRVRFQLIVCLAGWVEVVYEDQGPAFVLRPGDCVLQPPGIRHRVLAASPGLEVLEVTSPAEHETIADHDLGLPSAARVPDRWYGGQRFVRHRAEDAVWTIRVDDGFERCDTGIGDATAGLASVVVSRPGPRARAWAGAHDAELLLRFVLAGAVGVAIGDDEPVELVRGDATVVPAGVSHRLEAWTDDLEQLEVALPADYRSEAGDDRAPAALA